jgi:hypothetical protein
MQVYCIEMLMGFEPSCNTPCHNANVYLQDCSSALSAAKRDARFITDTTCVADSIRLTFTETFPLSHRVTARIFPLRKHEIEGS